METSNRQLSVGIQGMTCANCVSRVERALNRVDGISDATVNLATEKATVSFDGRVLAVSDVLGAISGSGYEPVTADATLSIQGMTCANCVSRVERALGRTDGVIQANVNLATEKATVTYLPELVTVATLRRAIQDAGYEVLDTEGARDRTDVEREAREQELARLRRRLIVAASFTIPVFLLDMVPMMIPAVSTWLHGLIPMQTLYVIMFALATVVQFGPGLQFMRSGWHALTSGSPDMNSLVMLGTSAAYGYSVIATFFPGLLPAGTVHVYFEASTAIITLILVGKYLEARAKGRTSEAIRKLVGLQPKTALVERAGVERELPVEDVVPGDVILVRPGDRVPLDGRIISGSSFIDESMITGEPVPVQKGEGAEVTGGTINRTGAFRFEATRVGADTVLAQIIQMVENAQGSKVPIQALADRVVSIFVPIVMGAALITFLVWLMFGPEPAHVLALVNAVAVLIIACPCAMGLATPTSIMVGTGKAAELGVLFRNGAALQSLQETSIVALDKTGTLTEGKPVLTDLETSGGFSRDAVLAAVAAVELNSEHPIAQAIVSAARAAGLTVSEPGEFEAVPGFGVQARVDGQLVQVGADRFMDSIGVPTAPFAETARRLAGQGKTPLYAALDGRLAAAIAVADPIKASTPTAIQALHNMGLRVAMITGDNRATAEAIASQLGIDEVLAEVLPEGKVAAVTQLQAAGRKVAFVGDGINDAPALAQADVGIAIGTGTDIAIESADVVLMSGDLRGISNALALSRATIRNIRQNLFWAFFYNAILIPVAAGVLYPSLGILLSPVFAAAAMALSSVFVLTNALRLRRFQPSLPTGAAAGQASPSLA